MTVRRVGAVGKRLTEYAKSRILGKPADHRTGQGEQGERRINGLDCLDHGCGMPFVNRNPVVQRPVRFHIPHPSTDCRRDPFQRANLVDDVGSEIFRRLIDIPPAEPGKIAVRHMRTDRYTVRRRVADRAQHSSRVARMEAARHIRARHHAEQRRVVAERPPAEAFAHIAVEVYSRHCCSPLPLFSAFRYLISSASHAIGIDVFAPTRVTP